MYALTGNLEIKVIGMFDIYGRGVGHGFALCRHLRGPGIHLV